MKWKKFLVCMCALVGTFSVGYAYYNETMNAAGGYNAGGNLAGRIHIAPTGISGSNIGMQKGDKFHIGAVNPKDGSPLGFITILKNENYNDYVSPPDGIPCPQKA